MKIQNSRFFLCVVAICSIALSTSVAAANQATDSAWVSKAVSLQGEVMVKRHGQVEWHPVRLDDLFYAGDAMRVAADSRAAVVLSNAAVLRIDQHTTLVFEAVDAKKTFLLRLLRGAAYFFSRKSRSLKVATPFANGVVEGTEFLVRVDVDERKTDFILYEGAVRVNNPKGEALLAKGQAAAVREGAAPQVTTVIRPRGAVQWALYYPPILAVQPATLPAAGPGEWPTKLRRSAHAYRQGDMAGAFEALAGLHRSVADPRFYVYRAALQLAVGRIDPARADIAHALTLDENNGPAMALTAVMAVVQNRRDDALAAARRAVAAAPDAAAAQLALSYAYQAFFDLTAARKAAQTAAEAEPDNPLTWARLAELHLSSGALDRALDAARQAATLPPPLAHTQTILGFAHLTRIDTQKAKAAFTRAITLDSAAPLPRLGLGLADIREGRLAEGRTQIEIAAGLAPDNALIRSYLGKAYFDEKRDTLDANQFEMAKQLDPNDPTPWFYDAIRKQTLNRPGEALLDMQQAITLNDNRAVFRSRLLLDEDLASRSASLGRIYNDLAFETLALRQGAKALNADPADFSAHRLLADMYASRPRHEIARVSELLQSQLLQPLNLNPVSPQLAESNLLIAEGQGPSAPSFNEFNPLFTRDRTTIQASAVIGENATYGGEATISGLKQWFSYSAGAFYYDTDGFRPNNDLNQGIYNVFTQMALTPKQSLQLEYRFKDTENGDLGLRFDMEDYSSDRRDEVEEQLGRIGYRLSINPNQDVVASVIYVSKQGTQRFSQQVGYMDPFPYILNQNSNEETNSITGEVQHIFRTKKLRSVIGAGYSDHDHSGFQDLNLSFGPIISLLPSSEFDNKIRHANAYSYLHYDMSEQLMVSLGLSFETYDQDTINEDQLNPKMGIDWKMLPGLTLRAAAFRTLTRSWASNQTLEPTQIAGFNQFFVDRSGTDTWSYCSGLDFKLSNRITLGGELTYRYLTSPIISSKRKSEEAKEQMHRAYIYYLPIRKLSLSLEYLYEDYLSMQANQESLKPRSLLTQELPLTLSYFSPFGWFIKGRGRYIRQDIEFDIATGGTAKDNEDFVIADLSLGYRFPKRIGKLSMEIHNVFDTNFRYYDMVLPSGNTFNPEIKPEREVILSMTVAF